jgi:hypothetical protein
MAQAPVTNTTNIVNLQPQEECHLALAILRLRGKQSSKVVTLILTLLRVQQQQQQEEEEEDNSVTPATMFQVLRRPSSRSSS